MSAEQLNIPEELKLPEGEKELLLPTSEQIEKTHALENETANLSNETNLENEKLEETREIIKEETNNNENELDAFKQEKLQENRYVDQNLVNISTKQIFNNIRHRLPIVDRNLSKIIHQPIIDQVSDKTSTTIARPSGVLGGAILAFIGSLSYLIFVKYVGITYNFIWFFIFFIGGFILGLLIELIIRLFKKI